MLNLLNLLNLLSLSILLSPFKDQRLLKVIVLFPKLRLSLRDQVSAAKFVEGGVRRIDIGHVAKKAGSTR